MTILKPIFSAYARSGDFTTRLSRRSFLIFALFVTAAMALSQYLLGTYAIGLALTALPIPPAIVRRGRDAGLGPSGTLPLLFAPMAAGTVLALLDTLGQALFGTGIAPQIFGWILRLSAASA